MNRTTRLSLAGTALVLAVSGSIALATQDRPGGSPPGTPELPPGWTQEDMQKCIEAGTPGDNHTWLGEGAGTWRGESKMWMAPNTEPITTQMTSTCTPIYDGRYIKCEIKGDMPGMGPFEGSGVYGYDNTADEFQSSWIDNHSTVIMYGTGERSSDGSSIEWTYNYTCPVTNKAVTLREVETITSDNTRTFEMFGIDPKSGREFKMMEITLTRSGGIG